MKHIKRRPTSKPKPSAVDWRRDLQNVLDEHNDIHATEHKTVAWKTRHDHANALFRIFPLVRTMAFELARNLGVRHIRYLMRYWTACSTLELELRAQRIYLCRFARPVPPSSAPYLQPQKRTAFMERLGGLTHTVAHHARLCRYLC